MQGLPPIAVRANRFNTAVALQEPDRVPFVPTLQNIYGLGYDVSIEEIMLNPLASIPAMEKLCADIDPDLLYTPNFYPIKSMELAGAKYMRWPGERWNMPPNAPYQVLDHEYMTENDYDSFLRDPSAFLFKKVLAVKYGSFAGLSMINAFDLCGPTTLSLSSLALPPVKAALEAMLAAAEASFEYSGGLAKVSMHAIKMGYPVWGWPVMFNPFDYFADNIRGLLNTVMDLAVNPELVAAAVDRFTEATLPSAIGIAKTIHAKNMMIPLHSGVDEFMSPDNYSKYYWPPLKKCIMACIEAELTPLIICEGNYNTRLETLTDIPPGKVVYIFEKVDLKRTKEILGKTACIAGGMTTATLISGTVDDVIRETRESIELLAPGGGYIMSNTIALDNVNMDNVRAWREATEKYS